MNGAVRPDRRMILFLQYIGVICFDFINHFISVTLLIEYSKVIGLNIFEETNFIILLTGRYMKRMRM